MGTHEALIHGGGAHTVGPRAEDDTERGAGASGAGEINTPAELNHVGCSLSIMKYSGLPSHIVSGCMLLSYRTNRNVPRSEHGVDQVLPRGKVRLDMVVWRGQE